MNVFTVPPNTVLLLKNIIIILSGGTGGPTTLYITSGAGGIAIGFSVQNATASQAAVWDGWIALNAGDTVAIANGTSAITYWISGALLPYVPGY